MTKEEKEQLEMLRAKEIEEIETTKKNKATNFKKGLFSKAIIITGFIYLFYFTERILSIFEQSGQEPTVLIGAVFGAVLGECGLLALIKKAKINKGEMTND